MKGPVVVAIGFCSALLGVLLGAAIGYRVGYERGIGKALQTCNEAARAVAEASSSQAGLLRDLLTEPLRQPAPANPNRINARPIAQDTDDAAVPQPTAQTSATITQHEFDHAFANQAELISSARVIPDIENGAPVGVKLYGIRASSFIAHLGLQNGDSVRTVNGHSVARPDEALAAYSEMQRLHLRQFICTIVRNGAVLTHTITVTD